MMVELARKPLTLEEVWVLSGDAEQLNALLLTSLFQEAGFDPQTDKITSYQKISNGEKFKFRPGYTIVDYGDPEDPFIYLFKNGIMAAGYYAEPRTERGGPFTAFAIIGDKYYKCSGQTIFPLPKPQLVLGKKPTPFKDVAWQFSGWRKSRDFTIPRVLEIARKINPLEKV